MQYNRLTIAIILFLFIRIQSMEAQDTIDLYPARKGSLICWKETRTTPRPLRICYIRVDLTCSDLEVITLTGEDPDGAGPAESTLTLASDLFSAFGALAAINANAFAGLPGTESDSRGWYENRPVDIKGMAVSDGRMISPAEKGRTALWTDRRNRPHIGDPKPGDTVWQAVSDWSGLLVRDHLLIPDSTVAILHPRSAAGFDDSGKWLLFVVADGRQPGISEGVSLYELGLILKSKGCTYAANLDGGGSSIMLVRKPEGEVETFNSPSGILHRPVPVMLGIRQKGDPFTGSYHKPPD